MSCIFFVGIGIFFTYSALSSICVIMEKLNTLLQNISSEIKSLTYEIKKLRNMQNSNEESHSNENKEFRTLNL